MPDYSRSKCPFIAKPKLWDRIEEFRSQFPNSDSCPVDIELFAELAGFDIIPKRDLDDFDAFLGLNLTSIYVHGKRYENAAYLRRVRFSIAHELGHAVLHSEFIRSQQITSVSEYLEFTRSLTDEEYSDFEWQANEFAGRLLVPRQQLTIELHKQVQLIIENNLQGMLTTNSDLLRSRLCIPIAKVFEVSEEVIERRLEREGIWPPDLH